jgi:hypothetical protein
MSIRGVPAGSPDSIPATMPPTNVSPPASRLIPVIGTPNHDTQAMPACLRPDCDQRAAVDATLPACPGTRGVDGLACAIVTEASRWIHDVLPAQSPP